jgi:spermidine/putrescine ABC transporter ATP-binding subunit
MTTPLVSIRNVSKSFGTFQAVQDISFDIQAGEFFSMLGPSGCGKTTLLRMLGGFDMPTSGEIFIDGMASAQLPPNRRPTNMVFQNYAIFPHLTVAENIAYGLRTMDLSREEKAQIVKDQLAMIQLSALGHRKPHELSGGQRQRVALARALARKPKLLLLDEPLSALDKQLREDMQLELRELQRNVGITFVFVTHDQEEALALSDRIAILSKGEVMQIDTPSQIYERPVSREVAAFIGSMNFFPGKLLSFERENAVVDAGRAGRILVRYDPKEGARSAGDSVVVAVRPEKIGFADGSTAVANRLSGALIARSYLGDRNHVFVRVDGIDKPVSLVLQNANRNQAETVFGSASVSICWPPENGILL